jgi:hypothetical protein
VLPSNSRASLCVLGDDVKQAIANRIIALSKAGERHPDVLCQQVLKDTRTQPDILSGA